MRMKPNYQLRTKNERVHDRTQFGVQGAACTPAIWGLHGQEEEGKNPGQANCTPSTLANRNEEEDL